MTDLVTIIGLVAKIGCTAISLFLGFRFRKDIKRAFCDFFIDADGMAAKESAMDADIEEMMDMVVNYE